MISNYLASVKKNRKEHWQKKNFRLQFVISIFYITALALFFPWFFDFIEARTGSTMNDPIVAMIPATNVSWVTFFFLYLGIFIGIWCDLIAPKNLLIALQTYCMVTTLRIISITLFPFLPPEGYIPLRDPVVQFFSNGGRIISHDLFFSGHVSTILSVCFSVQQKKYRQWIYFFSLMVAVLVLVQHVHYTIDVIAAPFATYGCFLFSKKFTKRI